MALPQGSTTYFYYGFTDRSGHHHEIHIYHIDKLSTPYLIEVAAKVPIDLHHMGGSKNEWDSTYIQGQELVFDFFVPEADTSIINVIYESGYKDFKLEYVLDDVIQFIGYVKPENLNKTFEEITPYIFISLSATDALAELKEYDFVTDLELTIRGTNTLLQILKLALSPLDLNLDFKIQLNTFETNGMSSIENALHKIYLRSEVFSEDGYFKCWDVIEAVLKDFNCKLKQFQGYYQITNFHEINSYEFLFRWDTLAQVSRLPKNLELDITTLNFRPNIEQQKIHPLKSVTISVVEGVDIGGDITGVVDLEAWTDAWDIDFFSYDPLTTVYEGKQLRLTSRHLPGDPQTTDTIVTKPASYFPISKTGDNNYIQISFEYRMVSLTYASGVPEPRFKVEVRKPNGTYTIPVYVPTRAQGEWAKFESPIDASFLIPSDGDYGLKITVEPHPYHDAWTFGVFDIRNILIMKEEFGVPNTYSIQDSTGAKDYYQTNIIDSYEKLEMEATLKDGVNLTTLGYFLRYGTDYALTSNWCTYGHAENIKILDLCSRLILMNRSQYKNFLRIEIIDKHSIISFNHILVIQDKKYVFSSFSKSVRTEMCIIEGTLVELITGDLGDGESSDSPYSPIAELIPTKEAVITITGSPDSPPNGILQISHGFTLGDIIRAVTQPDGSVVYSKALAYSAETANAIGIVLEVLDADHFTYQSSGYFASDIFSFQIGIFYYLSATVEGGWTNVNTLERYGIVQCMGFGTDRGLKIEIDSVITSISSSDNTMQSGVIENIANRNINYTFSTPFLTKPVGRKNLYVYRPFTTEEGEESDMNVLYWNLVVTSIGFSLKIDSTEELTGIKIEFLFTKNNQFVTPLVGYEYLLAADGEIMRDSTGDPINVISVGKEPLMAVDGQFIRDLSGEIIYTALA